MKSPQTFALGPHLTVQLDKPRVVQFTVESCVRFREIHGVEILEIEERAESAAALLVYFADAVWCALPATDRQEVTREEVRRHFTLERAVALRAQLHANPPENN